MDNFINNLPKPLLVFLVLGVGIVIFFIIQPPHSICDTQMETFKEAQKGVLFPTKEKKNVIPPTLQKAKEACQLGNSAGSCYEYFQSLRKVAEGINNAPLECASQLYNVTEARLALTDGVEIMARIAWGLKPPEPTLERFAWLQESELATFCRLRSVFLRAQGEDAWVDLRRKIFAKLPGEELPMALEPGQQTAEVKPATAVMTEENIWNRSLFSVRCDSF